MQNVLVRSSETYDVTQVTLSSALLSTTVRQDFAPSGVEGMARPSGNVRWTRNRGTVAPFVASPTAAPTRSTPAAGRTAVGPWSSGGRMGTSPPWHARPGAYCGPRADQPPGTAPGGRRGGSG